jgi:uncharacterized OB-fold protein
VTLEIIKRKGNRPLAPRESNLTKEFWSKLSTGEFTTTQCQECNHLMFPPREHCSVCWSNDMQWVSLSGKGKLYARTTIHAAPDIFRNQVPYSVGIIDLDEGLRLIATIVDEEKQISNDESVQLLVLSYEDGPLFAVHRNK